MYLRDWRTFTGLTLEQTGAKVGVHFSTIQNWETGVNAPGSEDLDRLAQAYGIHPLALFFHPDNPAKAELLSRAFNVVSEAQEGDVLPWLAMGERFLPPKP